VLAAKAVIADERVSLGFGLISVALLLAAYLLRRWLLPRAQTAA